jgi:hypothetical protein
MFPFMIKYEGIWERPISELINSIDDMWKIFSDTLPAPFDKFMVCSLRPEILKRK